MLLTAGTKEAMVPQRMGDAELLRLAVARNQQAFNELMRRHFPVIYRIALRIMNGAAEAEDVAQEAFLRLWRDPTQVREAKSLRSWLARVVNNLALDRFRAKGRAVEAVDEDIADQGPDAELQLVRTDASNMMEQAVGQLPHRQRLALSLVHFEDLSQQEAAEIMGTTVDAFESLLARARKNLKTILAPQREFLLSTLASERM